MSLEIEILKTVTGKLSGADISYMITGSIAMNFYAEPRMTRDIDIILNVENNDIERLWGLFKDDFYIDKEILEQTVNDRSMFNIIHNESLVKIDFIIRKSYPYRQLEFQRRRLIKIEGEDMWIVSPEDLILSKLMWAKDSMSELQLRDVKNLMNDITDIDMDYIMQWISKLELGPVFSKVKQ